jgi:cytochrome c
VIKMAFDAQSNNLVDVYFVQKSGTVSRYNASSKTVDVLAELTVDHAEERGLVGIALDPKFKSNRFIYLTYNIIEGSKYFLHISRFTLGAGTGGKIDKASEKVLIKIPWENKNFHTSGAMMFDAYGDLYVNIGDNEQTQTGPGNTADLRGGILRIHPDNSARGYSIPKGNFGEVFSKVFKDDNKLDLAAIYADTSKVKPEIYVKGTRNAYSLGMDPVRRWLAWGDVGPDKASSLKSEEYNLVKSPIFGGWPYYAGEQMIGAEYGTMYGDNVPSVRPTTIQNTLSGLKGAVNLPTNQDPIFAKTKACAITGPIFRYDGANPSPTQFPPQFDHKWLVGDCNGGGYGLRLLTLNATGESVVGDDGLRIFKDLSNVQTGILTDLQQGPDGSLYILDFSGGWIKKVDYVGKSGGTGKCQDPTLLAEKTGCADATAKNYDKAIPQAFNDPLLCDFTTATHPGITFDVNPVIVSGRSVAISLSGGYEMRVLDMSGRVTFSSSGEGKKTYTLPAFKNSGIYQLEVKSEVGVFNRRLMGMNF